MASTGASRREVLVGAGALAYGTLAIARYADVVRADHRSNKPDHVTISYDEATIEEYRPQLILDGVEPEPFDFHALHAESTESDLNAVYGFLEYPYQEGISKSDSHLGDHEPVIVFYEASSGDVERVDYAAYHWFKNSTPAESLQFAGDEGHRPMLAVDPTYHHYYIYSGNAAGGRPPLANLDDSIDSWLTNGLEDKLAPSQPFDPWAMLGRESWWSHTFGNWIDAMLKSVWFNLGISDARETSDLREAQVW